MKRLFWLSLFVVGLVGLGLGLVHNETWMVLVSAVIVDAMVVYAIISAMKKRPFVGPFVLLVGAVELLFFAQKYAPDSLEYQVQWGLGWAVLAGFIYTYSLMIKSTDWTEKHAEHKRAVLIHLILCTMTMIYATITFFQIPAFWYMTPWTVVLKEVIFALIYFATFLISLASAESSYWLNVSA